MRPLALLIAACLISTSACSSCTETDDTGDTDSPDVDAGDADGNARVSCSGPVATAVEVSGARCITIP